jgi:hypothetical protein
MPALLTRMSIRPNLDHGRHHRADRSAVGQVGREPLRDRAGLPELAGAVVDPIGRRAEGEGRAFAAEHTRCGVPDPGGRARARDQCDPTVRLAAHRREPIGALKPPIGALKPDEAWGRCSW